MRKLYGIILIVFLSGCVARSGGNGSSFDGLSSSYGGDAQVFADRTAQELERRYTPAKNPLVLQKAPGIFGDSLEQALRNKGFAVISPDSGNASGLAVSYTVDTLEMKGVPAKGYVQITLADGRFFTFSRELEHGAVIPTNASPSVPMPLEENNPLPMQETELPVAQATVPKPEQSTAAVPPAQVSLSAQASVPIAPLSPNTVPAPYSVRTSATAAQIAKRNKVSVASFCQWNGVTPGQTLPTGYRVHLQQPAQILAAVASPAAPAVSSVVTPAVASVPSAVQSVSMPVTVASQDVSPSPVQDTKHSDAKEDIPAAPLLESTAVWTITPGNLQAQVSAWSAQANYQLIWKTQNDFEMESHARFQGDFLDAVRQLFTGLQRSGHALRVTLYQGNNVLEVSEE